MSTLNQGTDNANKRIALYSSNSSLQTGLLAKLIGDELAIDCSVHSSLSTIDDVSVLLIDCHNQELEALRTLAREVNEMEGSITAALLNAENQSSHENLLEWPCVAGLFYIDTEKDQLIRGLECLLNGDYWVPRRLLHLFLDKNRKAPPSTTFSRPAVNLTKREKQILQLIKDGATNADISDNLAVSEHTVKSHLYNIYKKIGVRNRLEAGNWVRDLEDLDSL